jgi:hypothetical protein
MSWDLNEIKCASKSVSDVLGSDKQMLEALMVRPVGLSRKPDRP